MPEPLSVAVADSATGLLYQPFNPSGSVGKMAVESEGGIVSIFSDRLWVAVFPTRSLAVTEIVCVPSESAGRVPLLVLARLGSTTPSIVNCVFPTPLKASMMA